MRWGNGPEFTDADWVTECTTSSGYKSVIADGAEMLSDVPYVRILYSDDGALEELEVISISGVKEDDHLRFADYEAEILGVDANPGTVVLAGSRVTLSGEAHLYADTDYVNPVRFDIRLTCDTMS